MDAKLIARGAEARQQRQEGERPKFHHLSPALHSQAGTQAVQLSRFKGETWELFGDVMHNEST